MNYCAIKKSDIANGEGIRTTLFVSGCRNGCKGCFQPETWDFNYGEPFTDSVAQEIFATMGNPVVRGITLLGGEPFEPENQRGLLPFIEEFKRRFPTKTVWAYTGFLYEDLLGEGNQCRGAIEVTAKLLSLIDVLVDGRFEEDKKRLGLRFRGSENQRIIDLNKTRISGKIEIWSGCSEDKSYERK